MLPPHLSVRLFAVLSRNCVIKYPLAPCTIFKESVRCQDEREQFQRTFNAVKSGQLRVNGSLLELVNNDLRIGYRGGLNRDGQHRGHHAG
jgi:hypothetical protein